MSNGNEPLRRPELGEQQFTNQFNQPCVHQANGIHQNGTLKGQLHHHHHPFPDYCLNKSNLGEEEQLLSPTGEPDFNTLQRPTQASTYLNPQQFHKYLANLNQLNSISAQFHPAQQQAPAECHPFLHQRPLYPTQHPAHVPSNQLEAHQIPSLICTPASADQQPPTTILKQTQPLQLFEDQSDLNTTDINMDSSPCSESASDLNRQFSARPHKDGAFRQFSTKPLLAVL